MKKIRIKEDYDKTAEIYDSRYKSIQYVKYQGILDGVEVKDNVLDLGCGTGLLAEFLDKNVIGLDLSLEMLKSGKDKEIFIQGDIENLPFKNNSFDTILSFSSFMNLSNLKKGLLEVKRILNKNGLFVVTLLEKKLTDTFLDDLNSLFDVQEIKKLGEDVGFVCLNSNK
jgi:ubiquinone/menaquinone biosynthesis C-methylase UbiE